MRRTSSVVQILGRFVIDLGPGAAGCRIALPEVVVCAFEVIGVLALLSKYEAAMISDKADLYGGVEVLCCSRTRLCKEAISQRVSPEIRDSILIIALNCFRQHGS